MQSHNAFISKKEDEIEIHETTIYTNTISVIIITFHLSVPSPKKNNKEIEVHFLKQFTTSLIFVVSYIQYSSTSTARNK